MPQAVYIVFGALYTVVCAAALGKLLLRLLGVRLNRAEDHLLGFVAGVPLLSMLVFAACSIGLARKGLFLWLGAAILALAWWRGVYRPLHWPTSRSRTTDRCPPASVKPPSRS